MTRGTKRVAKCYTSGMIPLLPIAILGALSLNKLALAFEKRRKPRDASVLLSTCATANMAEIARGKYEDLYYSAVVVISDNRIVEQPADERWSGGMIYRVDLPFVTKVHLLGIPKSEAFQPDPTGTYMEPVVLEGDFPNYFSLYAEKGQQVESRYLLDPAAMHFVVEFCQTHSWEIVDDQLIFLHSNTSSDHDAVSVMQAASGFVLQIRPAIEQPISAQQEALRTPYGQERRSLLCPLCGRAMTPHDRYLICPEGHGTLLYGSVLIKLRQGKLVIDIPNQTVLQHDAIVCPSCHNVMEKMAYDATNVMIDTCAHCPYRWLDADEAAKITQSQKLTDLDIGRPIDAPDFDISLPQH